MCKARWKSESGAAAACATISSFTCTVGVLMEGALYDFTGGFYWLFVVLAALAAVAFVAAVGLPAEGKEAAAE